MPQVVLLVALVPVVVVDLRRRIIPDLVVVPATISAWVLAVIVGGAPWWGPPAAAAAVGGALLVPALARPDGMGMGDVKVAGLIGAALGLSTGLLALLAGLACAAAWGFAVAALRRAHPSRVSLPLAPFLAAGVMVALGPWGFVHSARATDHGHHPPSGSPIRPA